MHVSGVDLCHHDRVCPGRIGDAQTQYAILKAGPGVDGCKPVKALVSLLVRIAITPVDNLLSWDGLLPYEVEIEPG